MKRSAGRAGPPRSGVLELQLPLDLGQLGVDLLQLRRLSLEDVEAEVIPACHLVGDAAEIPLMGRELAREDIPPLGQLGPARIRRSRRRRLLRRPGPLRRRRGSLPAAVGAQPSQPIPRAHFTTVVGPGSLPPGAWLSLGGGLPWVAIVSGSFLIVFS